MKETQMPNDLIFLIGWILGLSGWGKVVYDLVVNRPKLKGKVLQIMFAKFKNPQDQNKYLPIYIAYLYIVNKHHNNIHIFDYKLELKLNNKWIPTGKVYGLHNAKNVFSSPLGENISINNFEENIIYRKNKPVEYGIPLHGWIVFAGNDSIIESQIKAAKITCIDAFGKEHVIKTKIKDFVELAQFKDIADMKMP